MRVIGAVAICASYVAAAGFAQEVDPERLIEAGHWKQAREIVEKRLRTSPNDACGHYLLSQIRNAFGDRGSPLPLAERAVELDEHTAKYHRQLAEVIGVTAQHSNIFQQLSLARRFHKEIDLAIALDPRDTQALRDLLEFYLLAPGIAGGDSRKAAETAARIAAIDFVQGSLARARIAAFHRQTAEEELQTRKAAESQPPNYRALTALARLLLTSQTDAAEQLARDAVNIDRSRADAYIFLAEIYARQGDWKALDALLSTASNAVPDDFTPWYRAAEQLIADGRDWNRAERYLHTYLDHEPEGNRPTRADAKSLLAQALSRTSPRSAGSGESKHIRKSR